jgi:two-component system chemotaxis response regulator CheB
MAKRNIIVIGASAGGVEALCDLTENLPDDIDAAIFVAMHVGSESVLPHILNRCGKISAVHAENNKPYKRGRIYVAPSNHHLAMKDRMMTLSRAPRENGHRPAVDVLFRTAARTHRDRVVGVVLSGGLDDGAAGLYAIKARGGVAIVQDPAEAIAPSMPRAALETVEVDYCLPASQIATVLTQLSNGHATSITDTANGEDLPNKMKGAKSATGAPEEQIPLACPECSGPLYELKEGKLAHFHCFLGHAFSSESLTEQHTEALERALWIAMRTLKERSVLHQNLIARKRNNGEEELLQRLSESVAGADRDAKLLREILDRI